MSVRVVIVDDHPFILSGLDGLFALEDDIEVVARCTDGAQALEAVATYGPDVVVVDLNMPIMDGLTFMRELRERGSSVSVVVLAAAVSDREVLECVRLGVRGIVLKEMAPHMLVQCVRKVSEGDVWVEKQSISRVVDLMLRHEAGARELAARITPREAEIVRLAATGMSNAEIADRLSLAEGTVKVHLHNIYSKLGVGSRVELMRLALEQGWI